MGSYATLIVQSLGFIENVRHASLDMHNSWLTVERSAMFDQYLTLKLMSTLEQ